MPAIGVVAAGHELTARAAEIVLRDGGNAFDAILAGHFAACVAEPVLASLGGGGFMIGSRRGGEAVVYDFFVQTPRHKRPVNEQNFRPIWADFGTAQQEFHIGQGTIATPGSVKGSFTIHRQLGSLPMAQIAAPAVEFARQGITLNRTQAYIFSIVNPIYAATPEAREIFCGGASREQVLGEGETMHPTELADTIERLAAEGEDLFYRGEIGQEIVTHCQQEGGHLTRDDLLHYEVLRRKPLDIQYRGSRVLTNPPPSSAGILIALALELFKGLQLEPHEFGSYRHLRLLAEVMALTQQARLDALGRNTQLLDPQFLRRYQQEVAGRAQALRGTTQLSVIDAHGNAASMTVSNGEGCGSIVPHTGIMLNNMLGEQDLHVDGFHRWTENQRMTSMMAPSLIRTADGSLIATGSGGSNRIRTALLQVIMNLIHFGMDVHQAVVSPRIHLEGQKLSVEGGIAAKQLDRLVADYPQHEVWADLNLFFGGAHTAMAGPVGLLGAGDPRRGGVCRVVE